MVTIKGCLIRTSRMLGAAAVLAAAIGLPLGSAYAQTPIHLSQLTIRLWPEFDKPGVLVFYIGRTADDVTLPSKLTFTLPQNAAVNAVAYVDAASGSPSDAVNHTVDGANVSLTTPNGSFHVEFYDPALSIDQGRRSYRFTWQGNYVVDLLTWEVQQPAGATSFKVEPPGGTTITDENGLSSYQLATGGPAVGQAASILVSYEKSTSTLTADALGTSRTAGSSASQPAGVSTLTIIAVAAAFVIAGGVVFVLCGGVAGISKRLSGAAAPEERERKPRGRAAKKLGKKPPPGQRFCPQCGEPALPGDLFCRSCGTKLHG